MKTTHPRTTPFRKIRGSRGGGGRSPGGAGRSPPGSQGAEPLDIIKKPNKNLADRTSYSFFVLIIPEVSVPKRGGTRATRSIERRTKFKARMSVPPPLGYLRNDMTKKKLPDSRNSVAECRSGERSSKRRVLIRPRKHGYNTRRGSEPWRSRLG